MDVYIEGIGVWGAGLRDWPHAARVLRKEVSFATGTPALPSPAVLPSAERRRSPATARIAVQVAAEACAEAGVDPARLASVFASSHGDTQITDYMCRELAVDAPLSPTKFHNSVHNAASGYWTIAVGATASATALSGGDDSFGYGLLEAASQCITGHAPVLLAAYDVAAPLPLATVCTIHQTFAVALVLGPAASPRSLARLKLGSRPIATAPEPVLPGDLSGLLAANPAARALPLLSCVARRVAGTAGVPPIRWEIVPC